MPRKKVQLNLEEVIRLYNDKTVPFKEKAKLLGTSPDTLRKFLRENGVDIPTKKSPASETLSVEKVTELYVNQNISRKETAKMLGVSLSTLARFIEANKIEKDNSKIVELREKTMMDRYGVKHALDSDQFKDKARQTCRENHGVDYPMQSAEVMAKSRATSQEHWGTDHPLQSEAYWEEYRIDHPQKPKPPRYSDLSEEEQAAIQAERQERRKKTILERYGVENLSQVPEFKAKAAATTRARYGDSNFFRTDTFRERSIATNQERYGTDHPMQSDEVKEKTHQTTLERYGTPCALQNPEVHAKTIQTNIEKYGDAIPMHTDAVKQKIRDTLIERYGEDNPSKIPEFQEKKRKTCRELYGTDYYGQQSIEHPEEWNDRALFTAVCEQMKTELGRKLRITDLMEYFNASSSAVYTKCHAFDCVDFLNKSTSYIEDRWRHWMQTEGIPCLDKPTRILTTDEGRAQEIDIYIPKYKLGVEIDPTYTHNSTIPYHHKTQPKPPRYHQQKSILAEQMGINLVHIYDFLDEEKMKSIIRSLCQMNARVYARNTICEPVDIKTEKAFLNVNHLQGYVKSEKAYGLFTNDNNHELLAIMSFGSPRYGTGKEKDIQWEMLRFCSKDGITVVGGASKLFSAFVKECHPESILSYADYDISNGNMYEKLGFEYERTTQPSYTWVKLDNLNDTYSWYVVKTKGFDNLFGTNYGPGVSNRVLMENAGYVRVFNSGNKVYIWHKPTE